ncbi:MAG: cytochrome c maturation protein CcmE [Bacteroidota bacterium]
MTPKTIIGIALIGVFGFLVVRSFGQQVGGYEDFATAEQTGNYAHVVGDWVREQPVSYDASSNQFSFYMTDEIGGIRQVVYFNPKPANFEDAERVVVEGRMDGEVFVAEKILVKCPSKYNDGEFSPGAMPATAAS